MASSPLEQAASEARRWLVDVAGPLWAARGLDRINGGYLEKLDLRTAESAQANRRFRVQARQIHVFATLTRLGMPGGREALDHGLAFVLGKGRHPESAFPHLYDAAGAIIDGRRDLYDLAFGLFALAHARLATGRADLEAEAHALLDFIETRMAHPAGGFVESLPPAQPRRQNPHMHLLEAALAWAPLDVTGRFAALAHGLLDLFERVFVDANTGALLEFFADDWSRLPPLRGTTIEPGHQYEWVWLLAEAGRVLGRHPPHGPRLYAIAKRDFDGPNGLPINEATLDGTILHAGCRLWPVTEWLKAEIVLFEAEPAETRKPTGILAADAALKRFLAAPTPGLWYDRHDPSTRAFIDEPAPASSFYHVVVALTELMRVGEAA
jgi:mannose-6-phosphate isomerase